MKKSTKKSLLFSVLALVLCCAMLLGTTFAWFTDSASTAVNKIQAGNLQVQLLDASDHDIEGSTLTWKTAGNRAQDKILWEPGATYELNSFKVKNNGNLALKYKIEITGIAGDAELNNAIEWTYNLGNQTLPVEGHLAAGETSEVITISGHMKESAGNEYQGLSIEGIGITVLATQDTVEYDSNGNQYDAGAEYALPVATPEALAAALANGNDVVLTAPVTMPNAIEITGDVTIYGSENGKLLTPDNDNRVINVNDNTGPVTLTLSGVDVVGPTSGTYTRGVSVYNNSNEVTIIADNSSISASYYALNIAGGNDNVKVITRNTTLTGWCAFQTHSAGTKATFENCTLIGNNDKGYNAEGWNDFATVVINENVPNTELTFKNCRIEANQTTGNKQYLLSVRAAGAKVTLEDCTFYADGSEIADDNLGNYISLYPVASDLTLTIDGTVIPIS